MKIEQITLHSYSLPYRQRVRWSDTDESEATYVLMRVVDTSGAVGYAEATPKPTWSGYTPQLLIDTLHSLFVPLLQAHDTDRHDALLRGLDLIPGHAQARGMVESALWSLGHRDSVAQRIPVSCTLTRDDPDRMAAQAAERAATLGVNWFKLKGGQGFGVDVAAVRAVRQALPAARIYVDANSAYERHDLARYSALLSDWNVDLLEDPCPLSPDGLRSAAQDSRLPLLVDVAASGAAEGGRCAAAGAAAVSVKPGRYGIPEALRTAAAVQAAGKAVCMGLFGESQLGTLLNLAAWQALQPERMVAPAELSFFLELRESVLVTELGIVNGALQLPAAPLTDNDIDFSRMRNHALV